jgi:hypothetical protein
MGGSSPSAAAAICLTTGFQTGMVRLAEHEETSRGYFESGLPHSSKYEGGREEGMLFFEEIFSPLIISFGSSDRQIDGVSSRAEPHVDAGSLCFSGVCLVIE